MLECFYRLSENSFFKTQVQEETTSETISNIAFKMMGFLSIALIYRFSDPLKTSIYFLAYEGKKLGKRFWLRSKVKSELKTWEALLLKFINKTPETNDARARSYNCLRNDLFLLTRPAENQLVTNLFNQYIPKGPLLELGSNLLNEKGESYLASLLPEEYRSDLIYSDCFKEIVEAEKEKTQNSYLHLDATNLQGQIGPWSQLNIVAVNVFDTILREKLNKAVKETCSVLKENGHLIILANLPFDQTPLISKFAREDNFLFPYCEGNDLGIKIISKDLILKEAQSLDQSLVSFIEKLSDLSPLQRGKFFFSTFWTQSLCNVFENLCDQANYQKIDHKESYLDDLRNALHSENQFKIILDEYLESSVTLPMCVKESFNVLGSDLRLPCSNYSDYQRDLEHHQLLVKSVFHAVIAQKIVIHQ